MRVDHGCPCTGVPEAPHTGLVALPADMASECGAAYCCNSWSCCITCWYVGVAVLWLWQTRTNSVQLCCHNLHKPFLLHVAGCLCACSKSFGTYLLGEGTRSQRQEAHQLIEAATQLVKIAKEKGVASEERQAAAVRDSVSCCSHNLIAIIALQHCWWLECRFMCPKPSDGNNDVSGHAHRTLSVYAKGLHLIGVSSSCFAASTTT